MSIVDDVGAIRDRMLDIQWEEGRLAQAPDVAFMIRRSLDHLVGQPNTEATQAQAVAVLTARLPVTIWRHDRPTEGVMHLSADEFDVAILDAVAMGDTLLRVVDLVVPNEQAEVERAFPGMKWPGPHRHVTVIPGPTGGQP